MSDSGSSDRANSYQDIAETIFFEKYREGISNIDFEREDIPRVAKSLGVKIPKNLGDVVYALRYRIKMPPKIIATQPEKMEWVIEGRGRAKYRFSLVTLNHVLPREDLQTIRIPDSTPEIIRAYALGDEQALLAIVRYNRLIDIFLGITTYSLQNHLRTTVAGVGQIEIDELYFGIDKLGCHYVVPVQAKGGSDRISVVQTKQDLDWCEERFSGTRARAISAQFIGRDKVAMFELAVEENMVVVVEERHYRLVPAKKLDSDAIVNYRQ
ncbi:endonuclease [uncultured Parasphingopyxis sp.]|mgnify:CR=1 FL=1|uniref:endonuclease n=1 Tax=uncultured Parasphingopyxis sp. TaxID=1547918 RepID=UPI002605E4BD|nr:endonuclease [uncultured Parasphingopyxis sp.]